MPLYCRPHVKTITTAMRFVVRTGRGVKTGEKFYAQGEEFPATAVNERFLRMLYEQLRIDLMPEAPAIVEPEAEATTSSIDYNALTKNELVELCKQYGLSTNGGKDALRARLESAVLV